MTSTNQTLQPKRLSSLQKLGLAGCIGLGAASFALGAARGLQEELNGVADATLDSLLIQMGALGPAGFGATLGTGMGAVYSVDATGQDGRLSMPLGLATIGFTAGGVIGYPCTALGYAAGRIAGHLMKG